MDHDRLAKLLFETFFEDFLGPFVPDLAAGLEPGSLVSLNADVLAEVFGQGDRRSDLVMRGRVRGREACFLVHLELQSRHDPTLPERMYRYHQRLEVKHGLDVYPLVVFTHGRSRKPQPDTYERRLAGLDVLRFRYRVIQLNRLRWRDHLGPLNPVTTALLPLMHVEPGETDEVRWESWIRYARQIPALDDRPRRILGGYLQAYAALDPAQQGALTQTVRKEILAMQDPVEDDLSWLPVPFKELREQRAREPGEREGRAVGSREGALRLCLRVLEAKLGPLSVPVREAISQLPMSRLEDLAAAVFGLADEEALRRWLAEQ